MAEAKIVAITHWADALLIEDEPLRVAASKLNSHSGRLVLVVNAAQKLIGTLTDGDLRRALLCGYSLDDLTGTVCHENPTIVPKGLNFDQIGQVMTANCIDRIPEVDQEGRPSNLYERGSQEGVSVIDSTMVIMAGGRGSRLMPHTRDVPKAMVRLKNKPMIQHIIEKARNEGFTRFIISVHYLSESIKQHFLDGSSLGVTIDYVMENSPLGTAGALSLIKRYDSEPIVITNCDVITKLRYSEVLSFHGLHKADICVAIRSHDWQCPFGVVSTHGVNVTGIQEKPVFTSQVSCGVYVLSAESLGRLLPSTHWDMPDLIRKSINEGARVIAYPVHETWIDVGREEDLAKASLALSAE